jgi:hypothetical protein
MTLNYWLAKFVGLDVVVFLRRPDQRNCQFTVVGAHISTIDSVLFT